MKAKDIMEQVKDHLSPDDTIRDAVNKMRVVKRDDGIVGVKGMIVLDGEGNLVGMVSVKDILKAIIPFYMTMTELGEFTWEGMLAEMTKKVADRRVREIMIKDVITVPEDAPLMECADFIVKHNLQRVPVVNKERKVVGIIYVRDLYNAIVKVLMNDKEVDNI
ncbi:MAG: CBS domain-containing protein [Nitrospirae bacterium]|nr:CBS domain-containing protein [Nitrospirota bacterium]